MSRSAYQFTTENRTIQPDGRVHGVVVGCCRDDGRWLLIRRSKYVAAPLRICFPGGGIDGIESQQDAVVREMQEELGITVSPHQCIWNNVFEHIPLTLFGWHASFSDQPIQANPDEVAEVLWLTPQEVLAHPDAVENTDRFLNCLLRVRS